MDVKKFLFNEEIRQKLTSKVIEIRIKINNNDVITPRIVYIR